LDGKGRDVFVLIFYYFPAGTTNCKIQSGWPSLDPEYDLAFQNTQQGCHLLNRELRFDLGGIKLKFSLCIKPCEEVEAYLYSFLISAIDEVLSTHWTLEPVWTLGRRGKSLAHAGFRNTVPL
jgi:hypothetical protein